MHCRFHAIRLEQDTDKNSVLKDPSKPISTSVIADCCLVVDVLGDDVRYERPRL
jgi:hypothetical protein